MLGLKLCSPKFRLCRTLDIRTYASHVDPSKLRNIALVAHIDSGKTTLTESMLLKSSYISSSGSVDTGSTTTDFLPVERERGITVQSASIPIKWKDWSFNLIDTPGHADFGMEVESASRVVDGAVVLIDSVEGVESQTKGVWKQLDRYDVPTRLIFLNKMDRPGASYKSSILSLLRNRLHQNPMALALPIASFNPQNYVQGEPGIQGLVDLVKWEVWKWEGSDGTPVRYPLPRMAKALKELEFLPTDHPIIPHLLPARTHLLENLSMFSSEFLEQLLDLPTDPSAYLTVESSTILRHLRTATLQKAILPVLCGSAVKNIGTDLIMDYVGELLASPVDVLGSEQHNGPLRALAWKVSWDPRRGWMTFVRVYSGKLTRQSSLVNTTRNQRERASKLLLLYASEVEEVDELPFGSVGVILGLKYTRTGDTLVSTGTPISKQSVMRDIVPPPAVISTSVIPQSHSDLDPLQEALGLLTRTDPSIRVDLQEGQIIINGLGSLHLEIVERRLREEWNARFEFGPRRVSYREGLGSGKPTSGWNIWNTYLNGKQLTVQVPLAVRALDSTEIGDPVWDGNIVIDENGTRLPSVESIAQTPLGFVAEGIASALSASAHSSLALTRICVQIKDMAYISQFAPSILTAATATVLRKRIKDAGDGPIMEPYSLLKINVGEEYIGKVVKDLTEHGGEVLELVGLSQETFGASEVGQFDQDVVYVPPSWITPSGLDHSAFTNHSRRSQQSIRALAPLAKFLDYSTRLRAIAEGRGTFELANAGFREVSESRRLEILKEIGRA